MAIGAADGFCSSGQFLWGNSHFLNVFGGFNKLGHINKKVLSLQYRLIIVVQQVWPSCPTWIETRCSVSYFNLPIVRRFQPFVQQLFKDMTAFNKCYVWSVLTFCPLQHLHSHLIAIFMFPASFSKAVIGKDGRKFKVVIMIQGTWEKEAKCCT